MKTGDRVRIKHARFTEDIGKESVIHGSNERGFLLDLPSHVPWGTTDTWEFAEENLELVQAADVEPVADQRAGRGGAA